MNNLKENKFIAAVDNFKECAKILKHSNHTHNAGYLTVLNKLSQSLYLSNNIKECNQILKSSLEHSSNVFQDKPELIFTFQRNLLSFYTVTDINSASSLVDKFLLDKASPFYRYYVYANGPIKLLKGEYSIAKDYLDLALRNQMTQTYEGNIYNNLAVLKWQIINSIKSLKAADKEHKLAEEFFYKNRNCFENKDFNSLDIEKEEEECFMLFKKALIKYDIEKESQDKDNNADDEKQTFSSFCLSNDLFPKDANIEQKILPLFSHINLSSKTITNITEKLFERGDQYLKASGFWMKAGLQNKINHNLPRHLIICSLIYSQLGQTMIAEGMYRSSIELLKSNHDKESQVNLSLCLNMYGRLIARDPKRKDEGMKLIEKSERIDYESSMTLLPKIHYLGFDFN